MRAIDDAGERHFRLTAACAMAGVSKAEVARKAGVTPGTLNHWVKRGDSNRRGTVTAADIAWCISSLGGVRCAPAALTAGSRYWPGWRWSTGLVTDVFYVKTSYGEIMVEVSDGDLVFGPTDPDCVSNLWGEAMLAQVDEVREMLNAAERTPDFSGWYDGLEAQFKSAGIYAGDPSSASIRIMAIVILATLRRRGEFVELIDERFSNSPSELKRFCALERSEVRSRARFARSLPDWSDEL